MSRPRAAASFLDGLTQGVSSGIDLRERVESNRAARRARKEDAALLDDKAAIRAEGKAAAAAAAAVPAHTVTVERPRSPAAAPELGPAGLVSRYGAGRRQRAAAPVGGGGLGARPLRPLTPVSDWYTDAPDVTPVIVRRPRKE